MLRRLARVALRLFAVLLLLFAAAYLLRGPILARLLASRLSAALGGRFAVNRVEGGLFRELVVVGLRTEAAPRTGALREISFARARLRYRLGALLFGDSLRAVDSVEVEDFSLALDGRARGGEGGVGPSPRDVLDLVPDPLPPIRALGRATLSTGAGSAAARVAISGGGRSLDVALEDLALPRGIAEPRFLLSIAREGEGAVVVRSEGAVAGVAPRGIRVELPRGGGFVADAALAVAGGTVRARVTPDAVEVEADALDFAKVPAALRDLLPPELPPEGKARVRIRAVAARVVIERVEVALAGARIEGEGIAVEPERPYLVGQVERLDLSVPDLRALRADLPAASLVARVRRGAGGEVRVERLEAAHGSSRARLHGSARLPDVPERWRETEVDLALDAEVEGALFGETSPIAGRGSVRGRVAGTLRAPLAHLDLSARDLRVAERPIRELRLRGDLAWPTLRVREARVEADPGHVALSGTAHLAARTLEGVRLEAAIPDLDAFARVFPGVPALAGSLRARADLPFAALDGRLRGTAVLSAEALVFDGLAVGAVSATVEGDGREVTLREALARGAWGEATGRGRATFGEGGGEASFVATFLGGEVRGAGRWGAEPSIELRAEGLALEGTFSGLHARICAEGGLDRPRVAFEARADRVFWRGFAAAASVRGAQEAGGLQIDALRVDAGADGSAEADGMVPVVVGRSGLVPLDGSLLRGRLRGSLAPRLAEELPVAFSSLDFEVEAGGGALSASVRAGDLAWRGCKLRIDGETRVEVRSGPGGTSAAARAEGGGRLALSLFARSPVGFDPGRPGALASAWRAAEVEGSARLEAPDLAAFRALLPAVARIEGRAALDLTLAGSVERPELRGTVEVFADHLKVEGDLPSIRGLVGRARLTPRRAVVERFEGTLGYQPFRVEGEVELAPAPLLALRLEGQDVLLARSPNLLLRADLDLAVTGTFAAPAIAGAIAVTDALWSEPMSLFSRGGAGSGDEGVQLFSVRDGAFARASLDVTVRAAETVRLRNNLLRGRVSLDLRVRGSGEVPRPEGRADFRDLLVLLEHARLRVESGQLVFPPGAPFQPHLDASARTRMRGYDLHVRAAGRLPDVRVDVASQPPLPRAEALVLLATGALPGELTGRGARDLALSRAGASMAETLLEEIVGPDDPDVESFLERFSMEVGRDVSATGRSTVAAEFRLRDRWFLVAERDRYDAYNAGIVYRIRFR